MDDILDNNFLGQADEAGNKQFQHFKSYHNTEEARKFAALLEANNIPFKAESSGPLLDDVFVGTGLIPKVVIKLLPGDFQRVNQLIEDQLSNLSYEEVTDHYLNQLDDQELINIFRNPDEWSPEDTNIARILLNGRGIPISNVEIRQMREVRLEEIRRGKTGHPVRMVLYFAGILVGLFLSPIFIVAGIGMGYYYAYSKSTDPDGNRYSTYEPVTRRYGKFILYGGILVLIVELFLIIRSAGM